MCDFQEIKIKIGNVVLFVLSKVRTHFTDLIERFSTYPLMNDFKLEKVCGNICENIFGDLVSLKNKK